MAMEMPQPTPEHAWLHRLVGTWELEIEMLLPGQPPMTTKGTDTSRMVGGFWLVSEGRNLEFPYECRLTLGYDVRKGEYVGTWVDSMSSHLWQYAGTLDASGQVLTLETEGPFPPVPGTLSKFRETTEFITPDHRVFTSARLIGSRWTPQLRINFRRQK